MPEHTPGPWSWTEYEHLLACYRSGQISERQWQEHLQDKGFRDWAQKPREAAMPDRVIMVRESELEALREALESAHKYVVASDHPASDRDLKHIEAVLSHPTPDGCGREGNHRWTGPGIGSDRIRCIDCGATKAWKEGDDG